MLDPTDPPAGGDFLRTCAVGDPVPDAGGARSVAVRAHRGDTGAARAPELAALDGKWLVLQTRGGQEWAAASEAGPVGLGCEVFLPWVRDVVIPHRHTARHHKRLTRRRPLFTGYLFVRLGGGVTPLALARCRAALGLVGFGERLVSVPEPVIAAWRERCRADGEHDAAALPAATLARLGRGDRFEVVDGPLAGLVGMVAELDGDDRVCAWLEAFGRQTRVHLPTAICDKL